jgi:hypothetical protein
MSATPTCRGRLVRLIAPLAQPLLASGALNAQQPMPIVTLTDGDSFVVPPDARLTEEQYAKFSAGPLYVNVHSAKYPNGEIRAQLLRPSTAD